MTADELIQAGQLSRAIDTLGEGLRCQPRDAIARTSLFTLLCLSGSWDRAARQLDALEGVHDSRDSSALSPAHYRRLLEAERARQRYFEAGVPPRTFGPSCAAVSRTLAIGRLVAEGRAEDATRLVEEYESERAPRSGTLGGQPFDDFRDAEDLMALVLEVLAPEGYFWVGWGDVQFLDVVPPRSLLDLLWAPARLGLTTGVIGAIVVPGLYAGSSSHADELVRMGRGNDWIDLANGLVRGAGAKVYDIDGRSKALVELQDLAFDPAAIRGSASSPFPGADS